MSLWILNLQWHMLLSTLMTRGDLPCLHVCVCVFVQVNLFALRTWGVFWWTLSHPEQKRQQVLSSAACFLTNPHLPKVQHSPLASQAYVFSCFWSVLIWSSLIFPPGLTHCSTSADPMGAIFQPAVHFPVASTCTVGGGGGGRWSRCLFISSLTNIFITALKNNGRKKTTAVRWNYGSPSGRSAVCSDTEDELC